MIMQDEIQPAPRRAVVLRVPVQMVVQATWIDPFTGATRSAQGTTQNVGTNSALVNFDSLPPVGGEVRVRVISEDAMLLETAASVIRVERNLSQPLASLDIRGGGEWQERVFAAAQHLVARIHVADEDD